MRVSRRPDIPSLVVGSGQSGGALNAIGGVDCDRDDGGSPGGVLKLAEDFSARAHLLLVPSIWPEPFGRVAARQ